MQMYVRSQRASSGHLSRLSTDSCDSTRGSCHPGQDGRMFRHSTPLRAGAAAALAARLKRLCAAGIELRARGSCAAPDRREGRHSLHGHDEGCRTIGLPVHGVVRALRRWDAAGVAALLIEAVQEAVGEIDALGDTRWSSEQAGEILSYAIAQRITPREGISGAGIRGAGASEGAGKHVGPRPPEESRPEAARGSGIRSRGSPRSRRPPGADAPGRGSGPRRRHR